MNPTQSSRHEDACCHRAIARWLLTQLREHPPAALTQARHPELAARALTSWERTLELMIGGASLAAARAMVAGGEPAGGGPPGVQVLDRDDVTERLRFAEEFLAGRREMLAMLGSSEEETLCGAGKPAGSERSTSDLRAYLLATEEETKREVAQYRAMLASDAQSWTFAPTGSGAA